MRPLIVLLRFGVCGAALVGCDDRQGAQPDYEERVQAARERVTDATCACAWSERLREQCLLYANAAMAACSPALAQRLEREQGSYADCIVASTERHARCLEETDCDARADACDLDVRNDCGPVPQKLPPELTVCLPRYRCQLGPQQQCRAH